MTRWLVVFRSHHEGPSDAHFVDVRATSPLGAIVEAKASQPPCHEWVTAIACPYPKGRGGLKKAIERYGT